MSYVEVQCENCKKYFRKPLKFYNQSLKRGTRHFCSKECNLNFHKVEIVCDYCGAITVKQKHKHNDGHNFCNHSCANSFNNALKKDTSARNYINGKSSYRKKAFAKYEHKCSVCGYDDVRVLEVHHINSNRDDNDLSNLIILCPTCHKYITKRIYSLDELITNMSCNM